VNAPPADFGLPWYRRFVALHNCSFQTDRLVVDDWCRVLAEDSAEMLRDRFVMSLLSDAATRDLPPGWQGPYDMDRAASWFAERQRESTVLLIANRLDDRPVGLLILSESQHGDGTSDIRLGYVIAEGEWGKGFATEVVAGLAGWCRDHGTIRSLIGGIGDRSGASARVLHKNGFVPDPTDVDQPSDGVEYRLTFTGLVERQPAAPDSEEDVPSGRPTPIADAETTSPAPHSSLHWNRYNRDRKE
jgi:RimJ/RimL family protein N-acetyltransferase